MNKEYTYTIRKTINEEQISEIVDSAFDSGISYWCDRLGMVNHTNRELFRPPFYSIALYHGWTLRVHDTEEDKWHNLTSKKIINGLKLMDNQDFESYDAADCDMVIQYALFGKQVYA